MLNTIRLLGIALLTLAFTNSCRKDKAEKLNNEITLSVNDGPLMHFDKASPSFMSDANGPIKAFSRTNYTTPSLVEGQYSMIDFGLEDDLTSMTFPHSQRTFFASFRLKDLGNYSFSTPAYYGNGSLQVMVTSYDGHRIKGTYSGVPYSASRDSIRVKGAFDILLPAKE